MGVTADALAGDHHQRRGRLHAVPRGDAQQWRQPQSPLHLPQGDLLLPRGRPAHRGRGEPPAGRPPPDPPPSEQADLAAGQRPGHRLRPLQLLPARFGGGPPEGAGRRPAAVHSPEPRLVFADRGGALLRPRPL